MRKCDKCIYAEPFGEHDEYQCNHVKNIDNNFVYPNDCAACKDFIEPKDILKPCPFCSLKPIFKKYRGQFHIACIQCDFEMAALADTHLDRLIARWNSRKA